MRNSNNSNIKKEVNSKMQSNLKNLVFQFKEKLGLIIVFLAIFIFLSLISPVFLTSRNLLNVLKQNSVNAIISFGMTYVLIIGGIDLSVGGLMALCGMVAAVLLVNFGVSLPIVIIIALLVGVIAGFINGVIITKLNLAPFIVTLAFGFIYGGFAKLITHGKPIYISNEAFLSIGQARIGPVPVQTFYLLVCFIIFFYVLSNAKFGKNILAIGGQMDVARFFGIKIDSFRIINYVILGFLAGASGIITNARLNSGQPTIGTNIELDAIAAVTLGGTSLAGGYGSIGGTLIGVYIIAMINNGLNIMGVENFWQPISKGIIILIAIYTDSRRRKNKVIM